MVVLGSLPWLCEIEGLELLSEPSFPWYHDIDITMIVHRCIRLLDSWTLRLDSGVMSLSVTVSLWRCVSSQLCPGKFHQQLWWCHGLVFHLYITSDCIWWLYTATRYTRDTRYARYTSCRSDLNDHPLASSTTDLSWSRKLCNLPMTSWPTVEFKNCCATPDAGKRWKEQDRAADDADASFSM